MPAKKPSFLLLPVDAYEMTDQDLENSYQEEHLGIVNPQHPGLNLMSESVLPSKISSDRIHSVIERLFAAARGQRAARKASKSKRRTLVGLAAPQIGEPYRIIVMDPYIRADRKNPSRLQCFINPEIVWRSRETAEDREGCYSAGPVWGLVRRPIAVKVKALTPEGKKIERIFEGFTARIAQHEIDHLDGVRFPDRIKLDRKRHWVHTEELDVYPKHIRHWPRVCTLARWEELKRLTPTR